MKTKQELEQGFTDAGFKLNPNPDGPPWFLQLDDLHIMEGRIGKQNYYELTVSRDNTVVAIGMTTGPKGLLDMVADYRKQAEQRTKQLTRKKPGRKPKTV